jgi:glucokinase
MILAGDIGGTKVNLALFDNAMRVKEKRYESRAFSCIDEILDDFLKDNVLKVDKVCLGVAGPVVDGKCSLTNLHWQIDTELLKKKLAVDAVCLLNDLAATAYSIPFLSPCAIEVVQTGQSVRDGNISVISAGTGLGQAFLIPERNGKYIIMDSEGGHCDFSPRNSIEAELLFFLQKKYSRVSIERVISGPGLLDIYGFFKSTFKVEEVASDTEFVESPATIIDLAIAKKSRVCEKTLKLFISLYGALAGNLALQYLSRGGVY